MLDNPYRLILTDAGNPPEDCPPIKLLWTQPPVASWNMLMTKVAMWERYMAEFGTMEVVKHSFQSQDELETQAYLAITGYTSPGDLVVDPFCGWSSVGAVAIALDRQYIGVDHSPEAIRHSEDRLKSLVV